MGRSCPIETVRLRHPRSNQSPNGGEFAPALSGRPSVARDRPARYSTLAGSRPGGHLSRPPLPSGTFWQAKHVIPGAELRPELQTSLSGLAKVGEGVHRFPALPGHACWWRSRRSVDRSLPTSAFSIRTTPLFASGRPPHLIRAIPTAGLPSARTLDWQNLRQGKHMWHAGRRACAARGEELALLAQHLELTLNHDLTFLPRPLFLLPAPVTSPLLLSFTLSTSTGLFIHTMLTSLLSVIALASAASVASARECCRRARPRALLFSSLAQLAQTCSPHPPVKPASYPSAHASLHQHCRPAGRLDQHDAAWRSRHPGRVRLDLLIHSCHLRLLP